MLTLLATVTAATAQEVALRMIVVRAIDDAKAVREHLRQGASFCYLAKTKSIAPSRNQWGLSGVVKLDDVQSQLQATLRNMKPGQISDVIPLGQQYAIIKLLPPQVPQLLETGKQQMNDGKLPSAIQSARQLLKLENDNIPAYLLLGVGLSESKAYDEAAKVLKQAQTYAPSEPQIVMLLGSIYTKAAFETKSQAYSKSAIDAFEQAMKLSEGYEPAAHLGLGHIYLNLLKQPQNAIPHLKAAVDQAPQLARGHQYLIQAYIETKNYPQAWQQMRDAQSRGLRFPELLSQLQKVNRPSQ
jgi:tetratricopeptide (TPR) repeat protein